MRDQQKIISELKAKCRVYKMERLALLRVIGELKDMLYDKFRNEDRADEQNESENGD